MPRTSPATQDTPVSRHWWGGRKKPPAPDLQQLLRDAMRMPDVAESVMEMERIRTLAEKTEAGIRARWAAQPDRWGYRGAAIGGGIVAALAAGGAAIGMAITDAVMIGIMTLGGTAAMAGQHAGERIGRRKATQMQKDSNVDMYEYVYIHDDINRAIERKINSAQHALQPVTSRPAFEKLSADYPSLCAAFVKNASAQAVPKPAPPVQQGMQP